MSHWRNPWHHIYFTFNGKAYTGYISSGYVNNISYSDNNNNGTYTTEIPKEYVSYVSALKEKHPNWTFKFYNTGLRWSDVVKGETKPGISAISGTKPISYRSTSYNFKKESVTGYVYGYYIKIDGATATVLWHIDNMKCQSSSRFWSNSWKFSEFFDQLCDLITIIIHICLL